MRLKYQLFLALLMASALLILLMYAISSWSFSKGLLDYVNQSAVQRASNAVAELESVYEEKQSWDWAHRESPQWIGVLGQDPTRGNRGRPPGRRAPLFVLADSERRTIIGPPRVSPETQWLAINNNGSIVGYLGYRRLNRLDSELDQAFEKQQTASFAYAGLGMVLLSAILAIPMASLLIKPLLRMGNAVEFMGQGDYTQRLPGQRNDELGELSRNINQLATTLEHNRESRQRWIAEISHELRTPMAVLRGEIEALQDGVRTMNADALNSLHSEIMRLNRLVDDLHTLSLSDIGALDYRTEAVVVESLLADFIEAKADDVASASLTLHTAFAEPGFVVNADSQRLLQLFSNLFQNSIRYTDEGGVLDIKTEHVNGKLHIVWADSSPGVPEDALPQLFDPLYRVENSRNRATGGSGLGLSIARKIVEGHEGSISASVSALGGLQLDICLPLRDLSSHVQ